MPVAHDNRIHLLHTSTTTRNGNAYGVLTTSGFCNPPKIDLLASSYSHRTTFNEVFQAKVINAASCQNNIGTSRQDLLNAFFGDVRLSTNKSLAIHGTFHTG